MSVDNDVYLVDWNEFVHLWNKNKSKEFLITAMENEEAWMEGYYSEDWNGSWVLLIDFKEVYESICKKIIPAEEEKLRKFLAPFFPITNDSFSMIKDIDATVEDDWLFSNISPASVKNYLSLYNSLNLSVIQGLIESLKLASDDSYITDFSSFKTTIDMWGNLLRTANEKGKGILIFAA